jgi:hypothetical protein
MLTVSDHGSFEVEGGGVPTTPDLYVDVVRNTSSSSRKRQTDLVPRTSALLRGRDTPHQIRRG